MFGFQTRLMRCCLLGSEEENWNFKINCGKKKFMIEQLNHFLCRHLGQRRKKFINQRKKLVRTKNKSIFRRKGTKHLQKVKENLKKKICLVTIKLFRQIILYPEHLENKNECIKTPELILSQPKRMQSIEKVRSSSCLCNSSIQMLFCI